MLSSTQCRASVTLLAACSSSGLSPFALMYFLINLSKSSVSRTNWAKSITHPPFTASFVYRLSHSITQTPRPATPEGPPEPDQCFPPPSAEPQLPCWQPVQAPGYRHLP